MSMAIGRLSSVVPFLVLAGSLALADDWFGTGNESDEAADEAYSDPWTTDYDDDPWRLLDEDAAGRHTPERFELYDDRGRRTGKAETNPFLDDGYTLYDDGGRRTGRVVQNPFIEDDFSIYDERGRRVREIRKNRFLDGEYDIYDDRGRRVGTIRKNSFLEDQYDIYDDRGRRIGRAEGD